jgi:hypothetical protein
MDLEDIMCAKWNVPNTKGQYCVIPSYEVPRVVRFIGTESKMTAKSSGKEK